MYGPAAVTAVAALLALGAPGVRSSPGWVRPDADELSSIFGERFSARVAEPGVLALHPEEWTSPYISQDRSRIYVATTSGLLQARSLSTWEVLWSRKGLGTFGESMIEHRGRLILSAGSFLLSLDQSGEEKWRLDLSGGIGGRMVVTGTVALIPVRPNAVVAVDLEKGALLWRVKRPTPDGITMRGQAAAAVDARHDRVILGFSDGTVVGATLRHGDTLWTVAMTKAGVAFADVDAQPILVDNDQAVLVASYAGGLAKLDAASGRIAWKRDLTRITSMARAGPSGIIVAAHGDGQVIGFYADSGKVRWRYRFRRGPATEPLWVGKGRVVVGNARGAHAVLSAEDGKPLQLIALGSGSSAPPAWREPDLAFLSNRGLLLALRLGAGLGITEGEAPGHGG